MNKVADYFLFRVAGLPLDALGALQHPETLALVRELEHLEARLTRERGALCDGLHGLAAAQSDDGVRRRLIELKRCVHNLRVPAAPHAVGDLGGALRADAALHDGLLTWEDAVRRYRELERRGDDSLRASGEAARGELRRRWSCERFRTGLLMTKPGLYYDLLQFLEAGESQLNKKLRRLEHTALAYFYRMATKTSPFSTYTATGVGLLSDEERQMRAPLPVSARDAFAVNAALAEQLAAALGRRDDARPHLPLAPNETITRTPSGFTFLKRARDVQKVGSVPAETFVALDRSPVVELALELVSDGGPPLTAQTLADELHRRLGDRVTRAGLDQFVAGLVECGFLNHTLDYTANHPGALALLGAAVAETATPSGAEFRAAAARVEALVNALEGQASAGRAATLRRIDAEAQSLSGLAGLSAAGGSAPDLVRHDCYLEDEFQLSRGALRGVLAALSELTRVMPAFNAGSLVKQLVRKFYLERHGKAPCPLPLTTFLREFYADCYTPVLGKTTDALWDPFLSGIEPSQLPEASEMALVRRQFVEELLERVAASGGGSVNLPPEFIGRFGELTEPFWTQRVPPSVGYLGQLCERPDGGGPDFVVNQCVSGYGTYFARYCDRRTFGERAAVLSERLKGTLSQLAGADECAELVATFGVNLQIHEPLTPRVVNYPGEPARRNGREVIAWSDLGLDFDEASDDVVLVRKSTGRRVLPLRMGPLSPHRLPVAYRILSSLGTSFVPDFSLLNLLEYCQTAAPAEVRHYPRIRYGSLVLMRETWRVPPEYAPPLGRTDATLSSFLELRGWARALNLPAKVFVVPMEMTDYFRAGKPVNNLRRLYKPFYVDFDDPLSCRIFHRFAGASRATLSISEMLPLPEQLTFKRAEGRYVTEALLESYGAAAPRRDGRG